LFRKIAAQIVIAGVLLVGFVVLAPRLRRALVGRAEHVSLGATR
jgi:hypothetical protein